MADLTLRTPLCDLLDIKYPIVLAGMGGAASPELAAAVSNAGGLGILAGAITDGRGLVAALALGAVGVWCGTVFLATDEANLTPAQKQAILDSGEDDTVVSKSRTGKPARMIKNLWVQEFDASGLAPLPMPLQGMVANSVMEVARQEGRKDINPGFAGQGVGMIARIRPAAEVLRQMVAEAHALLSGKLGLRCGWSNVSGP